MNFSVFVTKESDKTLSGMVEDLWSPATGYAPGIDVRKSQDRVKGKYKIEHHRGEITDSAHLIRVTNGRIITPDQEYLMANMLRKNKVHYKKFENVEISKEVVNSQEPKIDLPKMANIIYNP